MRIDYGTGHETCFIAWMLCMFELGVFVEVCAATLQPGFCCTIDGCINTKIASIKTLGCVLACLLALGGPGRAGAQALSELPPTDEKTAAHLSTRASWVPWGSPSLLLCFRRRHRFVSATFANDVLSLSFSVRTSRSSSGLGSVCRRCRLGVGSGRLPHPAVPVRRCATDRSALRAGSVQGAGPPRQPHADLTMEAFLLYRAFYT